MRVLFGVVVNDDSLEGVREVRLGEPDASGCPGLGQQCSAVASCAKQARGLGFLEPLFAVPVARSGLVDVDLEVASIASSSAWRRRPDGLGQWFGWVSPPLVEQVLLALHNLVVGESREVIDHWMLPNRGLDLHKSVLFWGLLLSSFAFFLLFLSLFTSLPAVVFL